MGLPQKNKKTKPPSQFGRLPFRLRYRIACLLLEGATSQAVLDNPEVAGTLSSLGLTLTAAASRLPMRTARRCLFSTARFTIIRNSVRI